METQKVWKLAFDKAADIVNDCNEKVEVIKQQALNETVETDEGVKTVGYRSRQLTPIIKAIQEARKHHIISHEEVEYGCSIVYEAISYLQEIVLAQLECSDCQTNEHDLSKNYLDVIMSCKKAGNIIYDSRRELRNTIDKIEEGKK